MRRKTIGYLIDFQCPQCGAPATLAETDRLVTCAFCRVKSYLISSGVFRYCFSPKTPPKKPLIYFPYWRFKGMGFACTAVGVMNRFFDISHQATRSVYFPPNVGFRSQALKLSFVTHKIEGRFIEPSIPVSSMMENAAKQMKKCAKTTVLHNAFIGDTRSLIYSPFYVKGKVYDAILNKPGPQPETGFDIDALKTGRPDWGIRFLPTLCPSCGWDLDGERESFVLLCKNCKTGWKPTKEGLKKISLACIPEKKDGDPVYLPFWRVTAKIDGIGLENYADFVRVANLPKVVQKGMEKRRFYFWSLGFKMRPRTFLTVSSSVTGAQLDDKVVSELPEGRLAAVNLPAEEAVQGLLLILAQFLHPREKLDSILPKISIHPKHAMLVYVPFSERHHELVHEKIPLAVNKNQLRLASNI